MDKSLTVAGLKYIPVTQVAAKSFVYNSQADIIPGVYEGGFTLWECTLDMLNYLDRIEFKDKVVIDIGCGLGLLGIKAILKGAAQVTFQDYNIETFDQVIKPQLLINGLPVTQSFVHGDWVELSKSQTASYDIALASEVIYREENYQKIITFLLAVLKPKGICYMINKVYYFGVGGSLEGFKETLSKQKTLVIVDEEIINTKKTNKKSILVLQKCEQ